MNKVQRDYAVALATRDTARELLKAAETDFICEKGITNSDGSVPLGLVMIDDEDVFVETLDEFDKVNSGKYETLNTAEAALTVAEDALIDWGLSIAPAGVREVLDKHRNEWKYRNQLIDLAYKLDARTVPKRI